MNIHYADRTIDKIENIESGIVFKYCGEYYIASTQYNYDTKTRTCANVSLGSLNDISFGLVVETYYNSYITIKGGE